MERLIKTFADDSTLKFDGGRFDTWCIYFVRPNKSPVAIKDEDIFARLAKLAERVGTLHLYKDFLTVYEQTDSKFMEPVLGVITELSKKYPETTAEFEFLLTYLYAGMVAEENREGAVLRKRIKRLGVHQLLIEERSPEFAAHFSRGKKWKEIAPECEVRGF